MFLTRMEPRLRLFKYWCKNSTCCCTCGVLSETVTLSLYTTELFRSGLGYQQIVRGMKIVFLISSASLEYDSWVGLFAMLFLSAKNRINWWNIFLQSSEWFPGEFLYTLCHYSLQTILSCTWMSSKSSAENILWHKTHSTASTYRDTGMLMAPALSASEKKISIVLNWQLGQ